MTYTRKVIGQSEANRKRSKLGVARRFTVGLVGLSSCTAHVRKIWSISPCLVYSSGTWHHSFTHCGEHRENGVYAKSKPEKIESARCSPKVHCRTLLLCRSLHEKLVRSNIAIAEFGQVPPWRARARQLLLSRTFSMANVVQKDVQISFN